MKQDKESKGEESTVVSEDFQKQIHSLLKGKDKRHLAFVRQHLNDCEDCMREEEFSTADMPS